MDTRNFLRSPGNFSHHQGKKVQWYDVQYTTEQPRTEIMPIAAIATINSSFKIFYSSERYNERKMWIINYVYILQIPNAGASSSCS